MRLKIPIFIFNFTQKLLHFLQNLCHVKAFKILALNYGLCHKYGFHSTNPGRPEDESSMFLQNIGTHPHTSQDHTIWIFSTVGTPNLILLLLLMALPNICCMVKLTAVYCPYVAVQSGRSSPTFQSNVLPPPPMLMSKPSNCFIPADRQ
jgi:hypothetical protein